jgi:uncharacterized protein (DUF1015 family)
MRRYEIIGLGIPETFLPREGIDLSRWSVIACDQFTSQPEYWEQVKTIVGDAPSTFQLILPEVYLGKPEEAEKLENINQTMRQYLTQGILQPHEGIIYVERSVDGKNRKGLVVCLDLEKYDYNQGSTSLIRPTEGTIQDRLPPRMKIRENASLELPHILVLIDDPQNIVIGAAAEMKADLPLLYDFELMLGSGHISGWLVKDAPLEKKIVDGLTSLADPQRFKTKYNLSGKQNVLLYAMGDGNHSLATAKAIWDKVKYSVGMVHPSRYALVELVNVHDAGLEFEPIHRVLFDVKVDIFEKIRSSFKENVKITKVTDLKQLKDMISQSTPEVQRIGLIDPAGVHVMELVRQPLNLPVGNLQDFLDDLIKAGNADCIDYVHGDETVFELGKKPGNVGFYLPAMKKTELFKTVILDGALPRKTFSMGEAIEKRFYLEARKIK